MRLENQELWITQPCQWNNKWTSIMNKKNKKKNDEELEETTKEPRSNYSASNPDLEAYVPYVKDCSTNIRLVIG